MCHKYAVRFDPMCAKALLFNTRADCFRAGLIVGKLLTIKGGRTWKTLSDSPTLNQSESAAFRDVRRNPVCQRRARLRIHSASRLYIFPRLRTAELTRLSASCESPPPINILDRALMDPPECRFSWVDIRPQSILKPAGISSVLKGFRRPRNHLDWAKRCPRFSSTPVLFPPAH